MLNLEPDYGLSASGPFFDPHDDRDTDPLTKRVRRGNGLVIRFLKRPAPGKPPKFSDGHEMVEFWREVAGRFFDNPIGHCSRMWWIDGHCFGTKPSLDEAGELETEAKDAAE